MIFSGKIYRILSAMALAMVVAGCSYVEDPGAPCPKPETGNDGNVHLNFMMTSDAKLVNGTRSDDQNHPEIGPDLTDGYNMEEVIDTRQLAFYIFVGDDANAKLLYANDDINNTTDPYTMITGADGQYNVTVSLPNEMLEQILGRSLDPNSDNTVTFRMVVLANATGGVDKGNPYNPSKNPYYSLFFPKHPDGIPSVPGVTTYGEVIAAADKFDFKAADLYNGSEDNYGDYASGAWKGCIPMFGALTAAVTEKALFASQPYDRVFFGDVWLLRSLAKVRVYDKIQEKTDGFPRLHSAVLTFMTPDCYMLPADALTYANGTQVHKPRYHTAGEATEFNLPFLTRNPGTSFLLGYLPEQPIEDAMPVLAVTIQTQPFVGTADQSSGDSYNPVFPPSTSQEEKDREFASKTRTFIVPMSGYKGTPFTWGSQILRNHIYDLNVDFKDGTELTLTANVKDWDQTRLEIDFMENPVVSQAVRWSADTYASVNAAQGQIFLKPWDSESNRVAAECTFLISAPKGARWTAYLIPAGGAPGSFMFKVGSDVQGDILEETVSGDTGTPAHLHIVSVDPNPTQNNSAILQVIVGMDGGTRFMEAPVAGATVKNWTINQARQ